MTTNDPAPALRLKRLLKAAGYRSTRLDALRRGVNFVGRTREWALTVCLSPDWLNVTTAVCELPKEPGLRCRLLDWTLQANRTMALAKFAVVETSLVLELDYRAEHIEDGVLPNLIGLLFAVAEENYPRVFRIVAGEDVLESLGRSLGAGAPA